MAGSVIITCKKCGMPLKKGTKVCSYCRQDTGYLINRAPKEKKTGIRILGHTIRLPWVTLILVILNAVAGIYKLAGGESDVLRNFGMYQGALQHGEYGRIILSSFLHLSFPHFISNMYALLTYGFVFENRIGRWKYLAVYLVSMIGSALLINFVGGNSLHAGASGAIWGLMAANLIYCILPEGSSFICSMPSTRLSAMSFTPSPPMSAGRATSAEPSPEYSSPSCSLPRRGKRANQYSEMNTRHQNNRHTIPANSRDFLCKKSRQRSRCLKGKGEV